MNTLLVKRAVATTATLGLAGLASVVAAGGASAASGGAASICVNRDADYSAQLALPNQGLSGPVINAGGCDPVWRGPIGAGEPVVVFAYYRGAKINLGHFYGDGGSYQLVNTHGSVAGGTAGFTVKNY
ncbi:hypothetical protein GCM10010178_92350 [Lentzea flava]|uniref:Peptidase inhibitor family I36 n=2 Tax=Lentzea flava TaxID=103732 RepID=A0ABQ2VIC8_9PSEU|nr:hypothetical protein GCM10010178_92350 [Lentzea flava]